MPFVSLQRLIVSLLATHAQSLLIKLPFLINLNFKPVSPDSGSMQEVHVKHVTGQAAATPTNLQRLFVSLFATHSQYLAIRTPSFINAILNCESTHWLDGFTEGLRDG